MTRAHALAAALTLVLAAPAARGFERSETRADCAHRDPLRQPFFGDLHVHTVFSFDAWTQGTRGTPDDAYRFARGEAIAVQPYRPDGTPSRTARLRRPLDFAMVSDHAELLGETQLCRTPGSPGYARFTCVLMRRWPALGYLIVNSQWSGWSERPEQLCGEGGRDCLEALAAPWRAIREAAEAHYDRSDACRFTTFVGFEWSGTRSGMVHRNVVFRNEHTVEVPPNSIDDGNDERVLWQRLERECLRAGTGCDALAIPHNSNLSRGDLFWTTAPDGTPLTRELAARRAALEPLVEIVQHKGASECRVGGSDELCAFEALPFGDLKSMASVVPTIPIPPGVYVREALLEGLRQQARLGVNPFRLGIIGSTDSHLATPGLVAEGDFVGHAAGTVSGRLEVPVPADYPRFNPGGLAVLWAEENSRDALFEAMRRAEAYATSGPRMLVRFFGGWDLARDLCESRDFAARGYAGGVPMGGDLRPRPANAAGPTLAVWALRDPGSEGQPGAALERIQIVKGWLADTGPRERVFDVARARTAPGADPQTCAVPATPDTTLCRVWRDPEFDPAEPAFYYARVVEAPTCRWTWRACRAAGVDCGAGRGPGELRSVCCEEDLPRTIRERAWTSPIWYTPARNR